METMYFIKFTDTSKFLTTVYKTSYSRGDNVDDAMKFNSYQIAKAFSDYIDSLYTEPVPKGIYKIETVITEAVEHEEGL